MTKEDKLKILKLDLQQLTSANDELLNHLLELSEKNILREGIRLIEGDLESDMAVVQYAAYLFRKRAAPDTTMPRFLRLQLNNMRLSQKGNT